MLLIVRQCPAVSASWIAFDSNREGKRQLYMVRSDGTHMQQITNSPSDDSSPAWSWDGKWLAFSSNQSGNSDIYRIQPNGKNRQQLTFDGSQEIYPVWLPNNQALLFSSNRAASPDLYQVNLAGETRLIFQSRLQDLRPVISSDGVWVAFVSSMDGNFDIYKVRMDGSDLQNLTNDESWNTHPVWSQDGAWIVFASDRTGNFDIYKMRTDGSNVQNLMPDQAENPLSGKNSWDNYPTLSPNDEWIAFASDSDGDFEIYRMRFDGSEVQAVTESPYAESYPAWSPPVDLEWRAWPLLLVGFSCLLGVIFRSMR